MKQKYIELNQQLKANGFLVHVSPLPDIKILRPGVRNRIYASDNLCMAIPNAIKKHGFPVSCVRLYEYCFLKQQFSFCSIAGTYVKDVALAGMTAYFFPKNDFTVLRKYCSNLKKMSLGLIDTHDHEYVSDKEIRPLVKVSFTLEMLFCYSIHHENDSKKAIVLKLLRKYLMSGFNGTGCDGEKVES